MTARLEAARAAVISTVRMYAPVHQAFSAEAERQLNKAMAELELAAVEASAPGLPPINPPPVIPEPDLVKLNQPVRGEAVGEPTAPDPAPLNPPEVEAKPNAPKAPKKGK